MIKPRLWPWIEFFFSGGQESWRLLWVSNNLSIPKWSKKENQSKEHTEHSIWAHWRTENQTKQQTKQQTKTKLFLIDLGFYKISSEAILKLFWR